MRYHNITKDDMLNGDGLRVVLWVAGCSHCCKDCQNPMTWDPNGGILFDESAKQEIFDQLDKPYIWLYTGDSWENVMNYPLMKYVDVLVDGEFQVDKKDVTLLWKGSSNQRVIDVQATLAQDDISIPVLHCGDHDDIPMGRETATAPVADIEENIVNFKGSSRKCCDA